MAEITGIGGVFLSISGDTKKLIDWYHTVLGLDVSNYGVNFLAPNVMTLITFDSKNEGKTVLNFTVDNLVAYLDTLIKKDVQVVQEIRVCEYGKFAQIEDILGNVIELWEPFEEQYKEMVAEEIKEYNMQYLRSRSI